MSQLNPAYLLDFRGCGAGKTTQLSHEFEQPQEKLLNIVEYIKERSAILEYDAGMTREDAELEAMYSAIQKFGVDKSLPFIQEMMK